MDAILLVWFGLFAQQRETAANRWKVYTKQKLLKYFFFCARCATVSKVQILPACILLDVHHIKEISFHVFFFIELYFCLIYQRLFFLFLWENTKPGFDFHTQ